MAEKIQQAPSLRSKKDFGGPNTADQCTTFCCKSIVLMYSVEYFKRLWGKRDAGAPALPLHF